MTERRARIERATKETKVLVELDLDGSGVVDVATGVPFYDHMLTAFGTHGGFDLKVHAEGDVEIEAHHTVEDVAICLGQALREALGDKAGITRFGDAWVPMDEALAHAAVDISGRAYSVHAGEPEHLLKTVIPSDGGASYSTVINQHVFETFAANAAVTLHVRVIHGRDPHHITEAEYKAVARALRQAVAIDPKAAGRVPSTKGVL